MIISDLCSKLRGRTGRERRIMRWQLLLTTGLAAAALLCTPTVSQALDLETAVRSALDYQPRVRRDLATARAAEKRIDEAYAGYLPRVDFDLSAGWEVTDSPTTRALGFRGRNLFRKEATGTATQMLFDGLETQNLVASRRADARATSSDVGETAERAALETVQTYLDVLRNGDFVAIAEDNVAYHQQVGGLIRERLDAGRGSEADVSLAESRLFLAQATLEERRGELRDAEARFIEAVGAEAVGLELPDDPAVPASVDEAIAIAMEQNPIIKASAARVEGREADIGVADAAFMPRLDAEFIGRLADDVDGVTGRDQDFNARARLRYNLLNGGGDTARYRRFEQLAKAAQGSLGEERRRIREEVRVAWAALLTAQDRVGPLQQHTGASEAVLNGYRQQFDLGRRSLLDLLDVRNELFQAQTQLNDAEYALRVARFDLLFTTGMLLENLGILVDESLTTPNWVKSN